MSGSLLCCAVPTASRIIRLTRHADHDTDNLRLPRYEDSELGSDEEGEEEEEEEEEEVEGGEEEEEQGK